MVWTLDTISLSNRRKAGASCARFILFVCLCFLTPGLFAASDDVASIASDSFSKAEIADIARELGISSGRPLDLRRVEEGLRNINRSGRFQSLRVETEASAQGLNVYLIGTRLRKIRSLTFRNVDSDVLDQVKARLSLQEGEAVDQKTLSVLKEALTAEYQEKGYYFAEVKVRSTWIEATDEIDVEVEALSNQPTVVSKIIIRGASREESAEIASLLPLKRGALFTKAALEASQERIQKYFQYNQYPTSKIDETSVNFSEDKLSVEVAFLLKMGERYQFEFVGNHIFEEVNLRDLMTQEILSQAEPGRRIADLIEQKYKAAGFHFVRVIPEEISVSKQKLHIIRMKIDEGTRVVIDHVEINGGQALSQGEMEDLLFEEAPGVLKRRLYWEEKLPEMLEIFVRKVQKKGFLSPTVTGPRTVFSDDKKGVQLILDVETGIQTHIGKIEIKANDAVPQEKLLEVLPFRQGDAFDRDKLEEAKSNFVNQFKREGFADAKFAESETQHPYTISPDQRDATIHLKVIEGKRYTVGVITIEGNRKTKPEVILREMELQPGEVFNPFRMQRSEENISVLGLFSKVEIIPLTNPDAPTKKDLRIVVVETRAGSGELGLGGAYEIPRFRLRNFFSLSYKNIAGTNQTVSSRAELGIPFSHKGNRLIPFIEYGVTVGYRAPYPFDIPVTFAAQMGLDGYEVAALNPDGTLSRLQNRARIEERIEKRVSKKVTLIYRLHHYERTTTETKAFYELPAGETLPGRKTNNIGSTGPGVILDFRDDIFNPVKGSFHTLDLEFAHPILRSDTYTFFVMTSIRNSFYFPLPDPFSLSIFAGASYARSLIRDDLVAPADKAIPFARLSNDLALGGQGSIRGFSTKRFAPQENASDAAFYNLRCELGIKLYSMLQNLSIAFFVDSGQVYSSAPGYPFATRNDGRHDGFGFGFRYRTPVGPLVVDLAQGLGDAKENVKFSLTVGTF